MITAQDSRYAYRLACDCIALGPGGLAVGRKLTCGLHDSQAISGFGIRWSKIQAETTQTDRRKAA